MTEGETARFAGDNLAALGSQMSCQWQGTSEGPHRAGEWTRRWQLSFSGDKGGNAARGKIT